MAPNVSVPRKGDEMDWSDVFSIIMGLAVAVGLPLALRSRRKGGQKKVEELYQHLVGMGIPAFVREDEVDEKTARSWQGEKSVGTIEVTGRNIEGINIIGVASQYGTHYFLDYLVRSPNLGVIKLEKTALTKKKEHSLWGKPIALQWKGDKFLSQSLNLDQRLESTLLGSQFDGTIQIVPEPKKGYVRIRTPYSLPSPDLLAAIDIIAGHIRSGYG